MVCRNTTLRVVVVSAAVTCVLLPASPSWPHAAARGLSPAASFSPGRVTTTTSRSSQVVPESVARRLRNSFPGMLFPRYVPVGFVFRGARVAATQPRLGRPRTAIIVFARKGRPLHWYVSRSGGPHDFNCPKRGSMNYPPTSDRRRAIRGRTIFLTQGAVGQSAWLCTGGNRPLTVEAWNDYSVTGSALMNVVAHATV